MPIIDMLHAIRYAYSQYIRIRLLGIEQTTQAAPVPILMASCVQYRTKLCKPQTRLYLCHANHWRTRGRSYQARQVGKEGRKLACGGHGGCMLMRMPAIRDQLDHIIDENAPVSVLKVPPSSYMIFFQQGALTSI